MKQSDFMAINKVLIIEGSSRNNSYTRQMTGYLKERLPCAEIKVFDTYKSKFEFCDGCNFCEENEKCKFRDLDEFFKDFEATDLIVFASPVYNGTFSAPMKALIDRFQVYYTSFYKNNKTQKIKKRRKAILLAAAGKTGERAVEYMEEQLRFAFSILNVEYVGSSLCSFTDTSAKIDEAKIKLNELIEGIEKD